MAFPTTSVLDSFTRANGALGADWAASFGDPLPSIISNAAKGSASGWRGSRWKPAGVTTTFGPDCEVYYTITDADASSQSAMALLRVTTPDGSYSAYAARIASNVPSIGKFVASSYSTLNSGAGITLAAGDKIGLKATGTTTTAIEMYYAPGGVWPGTATVTYSDTSTPLTAAGEIATSWHQTGANTNGMDDFGGGTISAGGGATVTVPAPAVATGDLTTPAVAGSSNPTAPVADATGTFPAPAVSGTTPDATVTAPVADATGTFPNASGIVSVDLGSGPMSAPGSFPAPAVSGSSGAVDATVTVPATTATGDVPSPTIAADVGVTSPQLDATGDVTSPAVAAGSNVDAPPMAATGDIVRPTVSPMTAGTAGLDFMLMGAG